MKNLSELLGPLPKQVKVTGTSVDIDGKERVDTRTFDSAKQAIKIIKKSSIPGWAAYDLAKHNEVHIENEDGSKLTLKVEEIND
jgi:hypothetical protein